MKNQQQRLAAKSMRHDISSEDQAFRHQVESGEFPVPEFDHAAHLRLAYVYLAQDGVASAVSQMREALCVLLKKAGVDPSSTYHATLTRAWIMAVRHFMNQTPRAASAEDFIRQQPQLLDTDIMLTHYSAERLFSARARQTFVQPDIEPIPAG